MEINHAAEVDEIFDAISYTKGASVIRMLQNYLVAEPFQVGFLRLYVNDVCHGQESSTFRSALHSFRE